MYRFLSICVVVFILAACGSSDDPGNNDNGLPRIISSPGNTPHLAAESSITLIFSESMDTNVQLGGDMASSADFTWTLTNVANDTLQISPNTSWSPASVSLTVDAVDPDGNAITTFTMQPQFVSRVIYVSNNGQDSNPGTRLLPKRDLFAVINVLTANDDATILLAAGDYPVDFQGNTALTLLGNVSIKGSYSQDFSQIDYQNKSRLFDTGTNVVIKKAVIVDQGAGNISLDGIFFDLHYAAANSYAVEHNGAGTVSISNANLFGAGIRNNSTGTVNLRSSSLTGSNQTGSHTCPLIYNFNQAAVLDMEGISVTGCNTTENFTYAIRNAGQARLVNNTIYGGEAERLVRAVENSGTINEFDGNNIDGGLVRDDTGSFINTVQTEAVSNGGTIVSLSNNTLFGGEGGIFAMGITTWGSMSATGNTIYGGGTVRNYTYGIIATGDLVLEDNIIFANSPNHLTQPAQTLRFGLNANGTPTLTARNNIFYTDTSGTGFDGIELANFAAGSRVENNIIYASNATAFDVSATIAGGGDHIIQNNTIYLIGDAVALHHTGTNGVLFDNNLIYRDSASNINCVRTASNAVLISFANNNFSTCSLLMNYGGTDITDIATGTINLLDGSQGTLAQFSNKNLSTSFENATGADQNIYTPANNDLRPTTTNSSELLQGGLDLSGSGASTTDFSGQTSRTGDGSVGWTIGAYEID